MNTDYELEVYGPGDTDACIINLSSRTPFGSISVGDLIHHNEEGRLRVTEVTHYLWEIGDAQMHKIWIDTEKAR